MERLASQCLWFCCISCLADALQGTSIKFGTKQRSLAWPMVAGLAICYWFLGFPLSNKEMTHAHLFAQTYTSQPILKPKPQVLCLVPLLVGAGTSWTKAQHVPLPPPVQQVLPLQTVRIQPQHVPKSKKEKSWPRKPHALHLPTSAIVGIVPGYILDQGTE